MKLVSDHCPSLFSGEAKLTVTSPLTPPHVQIVVELTNYNVFFSDLKNAPGLVTGLCLSTLAAH